MIAQQIGLLAARSAIDRQLELNGASDSNSLAFRKNSFSKLLCFRTSYAIRFVLGNSGEMQI